MTQTVPGQGLSEAQRRLAEVLANPDIQGSIAEQCRQAGVSRRSYYRWIEIPEFTEYVHYLVQRYTDNRLSQVWKALCNKAEGGDVMAIKLYFELKNQYTEKRQIEITGKAGGPVQLEQLSHASDAELDTILGDVEE